MLMCYMIFLLTRYQLIYASGQSLALPCGNERVQAVQALLDIISGETFRASAGNGPLSTPGAAVWVDINRWQATPEFSFQKDTTLLFYGVMKRDSQELIPDSCLFYLWCHCTFKECGFWQLTIVLVQTDCSTLQVVAPGLWKHWSVCYHIFWLSEEQHCAGKPTFFERLEDVEYDVRARLWFAITCNDYLQLFDDSMWAFIFVESKVSRDIY